MGFDVFALKWLKDRAIALPAREYADAAYMIKNSIIPFFEEHPCDDQAPVLFAEFIRDWLYMMRSKVEPSTYSAYVVNVEKSIIPFFQARNCTIQDLERHPKHIQDYYQSMLDAGLSSTTVISRHANVRKCLQYAFQIGLIKSNPADRVEKPRKSYPKIILILFRIVLLRNNFEKTLT